MPEAAPGVREAASDWDAWKSALSRMLIRNEDAANVNYRGRCKPSAPGHLRRINCDLRCHGNRQGGPSSLKKGRTLQNRSESGGTRTPEEHVVCDSSQDSGWDQTLEKRVPFFLPRRMGSHTWYQPSSTQKMEGGTPGMSVRSVG